MQRRGLVLRRAVIVAALALLSGPARAGQDRPDCRPTDEATLRGLVSDGVGAVQRGDAEAQRAIADEVEARVPCLDFAPSPRLLADVMVLEAIARFLDKEDWRPALDAALRLRPRVNRLVAPNHPIARHVPSEAPPAASEVLPAGIIAYVDGERATRLPDPTALQLVQVQEDGRWRSQLFYDAPPDEAFLTDPIATPPAWTWWGHLGVAIGPGGVYQALDRSLATIELDGQSHAYADPGDTTAWPALVARGTLRYGAVGIGADIDVGLLAFARPVSSHAQAALLFGPRQIQIGPVVGVGTTLSRDPVGGEQLFQLPYAGASVERASPRWDAGLSLGLGAGLGRGHLRAGAALLQGNDLPLRMGASVVIQHARLSPTDPSGAVVPGLDIHATTWRAGLEIGLLRTVR